MIKVPENTLPVPFYYGKSYEVQKEYLFYKKLINELALTA